MGRLSKFVKAKVSGALSTIPAVMTVELSAKS